MMGTLVIVSIALISITTLTIALRSALRSQQAEYNYYKATLAAESGLNAAKSQLATIPLWTTKIDKENLYKSHIPHHLTLPIDATITVTKTATDLYSIAVLNDHSGRAIMKKSYQINKGVITWGASSNSI
jgi:hypothetical protein